MSTRREKRPDLHDHLVQMNKAAGTLHVPSDEIVQVTAGPEGFDAEDLKRGALAEVIEQGCVPWCPLIRAISEVAR